MTDPVDTSSTRPYLIRALHEWCTDNGLTPHIAVRVDGSVQVPREHVKNGEIVLNVSLDATSSLKLGHDFIEFRARFGGVAREVLVPVGHVMAIYARENGQGMAFPSQEAEVESESVEVRPRDGAALATEQPAPSPDEAKPPLQLARVETERGPQEPSPAPRPPRGGGRPSLKRVK